MALITYQPQDTLFFRDGRPFNMDETATPISSLFPPSPQTLVGAVRAVWAQQLGWDFQQNKSWPDHIMQKIGSGEELAGLKFSGPILLKKEKPYFPVPALVVGKENKKSSKQVCGGAPPEHMTLLQPSIEKYSCDLGIEVSLPETRDANHVRRRKHINNWWLDKDGLQAILAGHIPKRDSFCHRHTLWQNEPRIGIEIDTESGTTKESALYATTHVRLQPDIAIALSVNRQPVPLEGCRQIPLGGEARSVWLEITDNELELPSMPRNIKAQNGSVKYTVVVLSPLSLAAPLRANKTVKGLPGKLVTACLPRTQSWGGWDSVNRKPLPLKPHYVPGSVLFMVADEKDLENVKALHGKTVGERSEWGFGLIVIGTWN